MLRAYYGGTFDPVHNGHLAIARVAHAALDCEIRFMPAADPPHRALPGADARQRAAMLDLAVTGEPGLCVDRRELLRAGRSYTIDTLHELRREYGLEAPIALVVGADSFVALSSWKQWQALFDLAHFVVAERIGSPLDGILLPELAAAVASRWTTSVQELNARHAGRILRLRQPLHAESATDVRGRIAAGAPWRDLVPAAVADYIEEHKLYRGNPREPSSGLRPL